jgi:glycosyltransferase involved in cell wall biosynthesis
LAGARLVWHVHGIRRPQLLNLAGRLLADATIAVTPEVARSLPGGWLRPPVVVPNPVDSRYLAVRRAPTSPPVIMTIARLHPEKGVDLLLRALVTVRSHWPDATAVVIGEAPEGHEHHARELSALTRELRLADAVSFAGFVDEPEELAAAATLYVQPSRREGFGLAVLEAMAAGVPVVAAEVEGLRRLVTHGLTGTLVRPEDPLALAEGILGVLEDPSGAQRRAAEARDAVRDRYSLDRCVDRLTAVYASLVDRREPGVQPVQATAATRSEVTPNETDLSNTT